MKINLCYAYVIVGFLVACGIYDEESCCSDQMQKSNSSGNESSSSMISDKLVIIDGIKIYSEESIIFSQVYPNKVSLVFKSDNQIGYSYQRRTYGGDNSAGNELDTIYATSENPNICLSSNTVDAGFRYCVRFDFSTIPVTGICTATNCYIDRLWQWICNDVACGIAVLEK